MAVAIPIIMLIASAASTGIGVYSQVRAAKSLRQSGAASQASANESANLFDWNASIADLQAADAEQRGAEAEARYREGVAGVIGSQRAGQAAGNIDVNYGSAVDVQADAAFLGELDALTIRTNAMRESWGYKVQALDLRKRADVTRKEGVNAAIAANSQASQAKLAAGQMLLGTGTSLLANRYGFGRPSAASAATATRLYSGNVAFGAGNA